MLSSKFKDQQEIETERTKRLRVVCVRACECTDTK